MELFSCDIWFLTKGEIFVHRKISIHVTFMLRKVCVIVTNTDALMSSKLIACLKGQMDIKNFKKQFEAHRHAFLERLLTDIKPMMRDEELRNRFNEIIAEIIFIGHPESDEEFFGGYKLILDQMNEVLSV